MVFSGKTLAGMGVENYSNTLVFTGTGNAGGNREIYLNTLPVPEPSTAAFAFTAGLGLLRRRR
jgi:uncharacterized protein (TIGR03382 family)